MRLLHGIAAAESRFTCEAIHHSILSTGQLDAIVTDATQLDLTSEAGTVRAALAHHRLLTACADSGDVLPVKFGTVFSSEAAVLAAVDRHTLSLSRYLTLLEGKRECAVKLVLVSPAPREEDLGENGRDFLRAKRLRRDTRRDLSGKRLAASKLVHNTIVRHATDLKGLPARDDPTLMHIAALLTRQAETKLRHELADLASDIEGASLGLSMSDPGPAYSFSGDHGAVLSDCNA